MPERWPTLGPSNAHTYAERAVEVMLPFVEPDIDELTLTRLCIEAYETFRHPAVVPLVQLDHRQWIQELFHGPTLAFKDVALQLVGRMFDHVLGERGRAGHHRRRHQRRHRVGGDRRSRRLSTRRHRHPLPTRSHQRGAAPPDDHGRPTQRPHRRDRGHLRRLPGPGQGDVQRRAVPRTEPAVGGELDQLGAGHVADRVLRDRCRDVRRTGHVQRADGQLRQRPVGVDRPGDGRVRSATSSWRRTPTTSSPASSTTAT